MTTATTVQNQEAKQANVNAKDTGAKLREQAAKSSAFNAICHIFALRERSRKQVTMGSLKATMIREGFNFNNNELAGVLQFLAQNGFGKLDYDLKGKLRALKGIKVPLQTIGKTALSKQDLPDIKPSDDVHFTAATKAIKKPSAVPVSQSLPATITVEVDHKLVTYEVPGGIMPKDLLTLIAQPVKRRS